MSDSRAEQSFKGMFIGLIVIMFSIIGCTGATIVVIDAACNEYINRWAPIYPDAQELTVEYDFIRPRGMGNTYQVLHVTAIQSDVEKWYVEMREKAGRSDGIGRAGFNLEPAEDGGTMIYLYSSCAWT